MEKLYEQIIEDLNARRQWEERQTLFYEMRHDGLPRKFKPWPHAADLHFPLADTVIEKHKTFYYQMLFSPETLAAFISMKTAYDPYAKFCGQWFDYKMKHKSNFEKSIMVLIDYVLMAGGAPLKCTWDENQGRVNFDAIDPMFFVVPMSTKELEEADRACHILQYTTESYKRDKRFKQDDEFLKRITGRGNEASQNYIDAKYRREGMTVGANDNQIIIWEVYTRDGSSWKVSWISPLFPKEEARASIRLTYDHGKLPFIYFLREIKDNGYYSPRGVPELLKHDEAYLTKLLNEKADALTLYNRPFYHSNGAIPNVGNIKMVPGQIMPFALNRVDPGPPPMGFDQEMVMHRMLAEARAGTPDFGIGQQINTRERRTATEVQQIGNLVGAGMDLRGRIFKLCLGKLYSQAWSLLTQYDRKSLDYISGEEMGRLEPEAFKGEYSIAPTVSADNINKQFVLQKAVARLQMFANSPFVRQGDLVRSVIEADDARLVKQLYVEPAEKQMEQAEEQADEISNMLIGFPVQPSRIDDHVAHIQTLVMFVERRAATQDPVPPDIAAIMIQHSALHAQALNATPQGREILAQMQPRIQAAAGWLSGLIDQSIKSAQALQPQPASAIPQQEASPSLPEPQAAPPAPQPAGVVQSMGGQNETMAM